MAETYCFTKYTLLKNAFRGIIMCSYFLTEMKKKMKLSVTIVLLSIASYAFAQSNNSNSRNTKIDEDEKKRLENKFKALETFYINDDGLVVYQIQGTNQTSRSHEETPDTTNNSASSDSKNIERLEIEGQFFIIEETESPKNPSTQRPVNSSIVPSNGTQTPTANRAPVLPGIIKKEALQPTETSYSSGMSEDTPIRAIRNTSIEEQDKAPQPNINLAETKAENTTPAKKSVFDKKNRQAQFKTMEEAALAVEALLDDLRREQAQITSAGSMSSRLSGGAGRSTLRKKPATNPSYISSNSSDYTPNKSQTIYEEETSPFGDQPTYYINGKEVDRAEVNRLRKREIISKEVRTRNTVSGNPNGEVWYEVRYDN